MRNENEYIEKYLEQYLDTDPSPGFAVLLQGEWGCGKTWFIKNLIEKYSQETDRENGKDFLYVSLYSVRSSNEIEYQLFQQLHPILSSKGMGLAGRILKGALRGTLKIDLGGDSNSEGNINLGMPDIYLPDFMKKSGDRILVFDDLERCSMELEDILGYINSYVEHQGHKVIIIANEDELRKREEKEEENSSNYSIVKEKLIGKTFRVAYDLESAFASFVRETKDDKIKDLLNLHKNRIIEIFDLAGYKNLRHLKQSLWDFERFYNDIPKKFKDNPELLHDLLSLFLIFSFEIKGGKIAPSEFPKLSSMYLSDIMPNPSEEKRALSPFREVVHKYSLNALDVLLPDKCWGKLFDKGYLSEDEISQSLEKSSYSQDESIPDWVKVWHFTNLEDAEFASLLPKVIEQWGKRDFTKPGEILHVAGLFLHLSQIGLYEKSSKEILKESKDYIQGIKESRKWEKYAKDYMSSLENDHFGGLTYLGYELDEFQEILQYVQKKLEESWTEGRPQAGKELSDILVRDTAMFRRIITFADPTARDYNETPIFKYIDADGFLKAFLKLTNRQRITFGSAIQKRYKHKEIARKIIEEISFLKAFDSLLKKEISRSRGKVSGYVMKSIREIYLADAIDNLESVADPKR